MSKLRLAESIRLGSLLIANPEGGRADRCAIGMSNAANGCLHKMLHYGDGAGEMINARALSDNYPWLLEVTTTCACGTVCTGSRNIIHRFDLHVMGHNHDMTLEQLCDFIDSIDPTPREPQVQQQPLMACPCESGEPLYRDELCKECYFEALLCEESDRREGPRI